MHKETAEVIREVIDVILTGGGDREMQIYVDDTAALSRVAAEVPEAMDALHLCAAVSNVPEDYGNTDAGIADVEAIRAGAITLAHAMDFETFHDKDADESPIYGTRLFGDFEDADYCPACGWNSDSHDMRQFDKRTGELGVCPEREAPSVEAAEDADPCADGCPRGCAHDAPRAASPEMRILPLSEKERAALAQPDGYVDLPCVNVKTGERYTVRVVRAEDDAEGADGRA